MVYPGLFNSSYQPSPQEIIFIHTPQNQLGPPLIGEILVTLLQGVLVVQYYEYLCLFWHERRWTKWLVHGTFLTCTIKFAYVWWFSWDRFVPHYGDWAYLATFSAISVPIGISSTIPSAICQVFFIHRCWALGHNWFFLIPAVLALITTVGGGISLTVGSAMAAGGSVTATNIILTSINLSLASGLACDVFITVFTCYYLIREKTGFKSTDNLVTRLVRISIESVTGPTIVALINLVLSNESINNQWFLVPNLVLSHVYGCSLLYSVNARKNMGMNLTVVSAGSAHANRSGGGSGQNAWIPAQVWRAKSWGLNTTRKSDAFPLESSSRSQQRMPGIIVEMQSTNQSDIKSQGSGTDAFILTNGIGHGETDSVPSFQVEGGNRKAFLRT